jgi:hypothetical protein
MPDASKSYQWRTRLTVSAISPFPLRGLVVTPSGRYFSSISNSRIPSIATNFDHQAGNAYSGNYGQRAENYGWAAHLLGAKNQSGSSEKFEYGMPSRPNQTLLARTALAEYKPNPKK